MSVSRIVPDLSVTDLGRDSAAHAAVLGLEVVMDHGWIRTLASPDGRHQLGLITADLTAPVNPALSVGLDDPAEVDAAHERALVHGLTVVHGPRDEAWGVRRFFWRDASGNVVNVLAHR